MAAAEAAEELRRISAMEDTGGNRLKPGHRTERGFRLKPGHQTTPEVQTKAGLQTQPIIDLIFLGMGEDGHVASLFPGNPPPTPEPIYRPVRASKPPPDRITLGYDTIAAAKEVWVLASGPGKEAALNASLGKDRARGQSSLFLPQDTLAKNAGLTPTPLNDSLAAGSKTPLGKVIASRERTLILSDIRL